MSTERILYIVVPGVLAAISIIIFILALRVSYVIEVIKDPERHKGVKLTFTNVFASAFGSAPTPELAALRNALRMRLILSMMFLVASAVLSQILRIQAWQAANG